MLEKDEANACRFPDSLLLLLQILAKEEEVHGRRHPGGANTTHKYGASFEQRNTEAVQFIWTRIGLQ